MACSVLALIGACFELGVELTLASRVCSPGHQPRGRDVETHRGLDRVRSKRYLTLASLLQPSSYTIQARGAGAGGRHPVTTGGAV